MSENETKHTVEDPLTAEQKEAFFAASQDARKIFTAGRIAVFNGWALLVLGGLAALLGLGSLMAMATGLALLALGWNELRGRSLLQRFDARGPRILGWNQIALMVVIVLYCVVAIHRALNGTNPEMAELEELAGIESGLIGELSAVAYVVVMGLTVIFQGLLSRYYFQRGKLVQRYLRETPRWIVELLKGNASAL
jgi:type IV secretory pathway VirB2 component (pilin)